MPTPAVITAFIDAAATPKLFGDRADNAPPVHSPHLNDPSFSGAKHAMFRGETRRV